MVNVIQATPIWSYCCKINYSSYSIYSTSRCYQKHAKTNSMSKMALLLLLELEYVLQETNVSVFLFKNCLIQCQPSFFVIIYEIQQSLNEQGFRQFLYPPPPHLTLPGNYCLFDLCIFFILLLCKKCLRGLVSLSQSVITHICLIYCPRFAPNKCSGIEFVGLMLFLPFSASLRSALRWSCDRCLGQVRFGS